MRLFLDNIVKSSHSAQYINHVVDKLCDSRPHVKLMGYLIAGKVVGKLAGDCQVEVAHRFMDAMNIKELPTIDDLSQEHLALIVSPLLLYLKRSLLNC